MTALTPDLGRTIADRGPSTPCLGLHRGIVEVKQFFRERDAVVFTFALPAVLLVLLGSLISGVYEAPR
jgi:ABC-2 type transport system permease protein